MSTELYEMKIKRNGSPTVSLTQFNGGQEDGLCLQLTLRWDAFVGLTRDEVKALRNEMTNWLEG